MNEFISKLHQFLADEVELLEDLAMDVDSPEATNREKAAAIMLHAGQSARVSAIRDVLELLEVK